ncbi:MAG: hypothetical protein FJ290_14210, partial [Planctomycetes bacterium]|nr:hypothetical protein [Planctomycetota bacterium]
MNAHEWSLHLAAGMVAAALLLAARTTAGETTQAPATDLRDMAGQKVSGHERLVWRYTELTVEWGFKKGTENLPFDGRIESTHSLGMLGTAKPLSGDGRTTMAGPLSWKSPAGGNARRGIVVPVLYTSAVRGPARTILTVRTGSGSFSFQPIDLETGPILAPEFGFFVLATPQPKPEPKPVPATQKEFPPAAEMLTGKVDARDGTTAVAGWGSKQTPSVFAYPGKEPGTLLGGIIKLPPRSIAVHPGPDCDIAVGWKSPIAGAVVVKGRVADAHPSGGNGVEWSVVHDSKAGRKVLARGAIDRGGVWSAGFSPYPAGGEGEQRDGLKAALQTTVERGDLLSIVIGNRGEYTCDTTSVELTIAEAGGQGRVWDLAKDVVDNIQAGNPHADSLGNAAVWHFYAPGRQPGQGGLWRPPKLPFDSKATTAREFMAELAAHKLKTIRERVREHPEQTWEGAMRSLYGDMKLPPMPVPPFDPAMSVEVPDK